MIQLNFDKCDGLLPVVVQDDASGEVLMLAYINIQAWEETLKSGYATYWSRSRNELWKKGQTSGNLQQIQSIHIDCDNDAVLFKVTQIGGAACHVGYKSCFYRKVVGDRLVIAGSKVFDPAKVYKKED